MCSVLVCTNWLWEFPEPTSRTVFEANDIKAFILSFDQEDRQVGRAWVQLRQLSRTTLKPESLSREGGVENHYKTAMLQIRNAQETLKLTPPLNSIALKHLLIPTNSFDVLRPFSSYMGTLCDPYDVVDSKSRKPQFSTSYIWTQYTSSHGGLQC